MAPPVFLLSMLLTTVPTILCYPSSFMDLEDKARNKSSIRFLAIGDWGGLPNPPYITPIEKATAQEMGKVAQQLGADFVLALGDNFYYKGVNSVHDPRFQDTFENIFTADSLNIPWYVVAGNHDHAGNVKAQIEYSRLSERWRFPNYYYELNFRVPRTGSTLTILMVDTVLLCGNSDDYEDQKPRGPVSAVEANRQLQWIQKRLERSKADFLLVAGHYPVWSVSEHGPTECLLRQLRPLLVKHQATAYLCGHDHNLQYLQESGVGYVVSGAGNFMEADMTHRHHVPRGSLKFFTGAASTMGGFVHAEVTKKRMDLTFYQARGTSLYRTSLPRRDIDQSDAEN
ncbi:tartrate-resistant acid phosphatase type 5a [Anguilla anguilla]|uniref:tartrate-resistant acid phosphatase type 5a n=1 Tax=Anguilla anguilla TaxID=7936 RepID=UPI0015B33EC3|nr:tartrate-resistant acid phosphatase type 5a [Anguilla anguilla]XP_035260786.1 tartrate-resistant acid phosphatase type 5a [Anguilla anguilla]XP_035260787.1 tartrate-resistant acid phosphatase type 5a [Anguilla anguilla]